MSTASRVVTIATLALSALTFRASAQKASSEVDYAARVSQTIWVNTYEWLNDELGLQYGERCTMIVGATVEVVGIDGDRVLVIYYDPRISYEESFLRGTSCDNVVFAYLSKEKFARITANDPQVRAQQQRELGGVKKLIQDWRRARIAKRFAKPK